jgi:uncharacterized coiled-coil protein SlyX
MLAPDVNDTINKLTDAYSGIVAVDSFAMTCQSIQIVPIPNEPDWLPAVSSEIKQLDLAADAWQQDRADILAPVLLAFQNFYASFAGVANMLNPATSNNADFWIGILSQTLLPAVNNSLAVTKGAEVKLQKRMAEFSTVLPQMDKSIAAGWSALSSEEQQMLKLTEQLGELNQSVQALGSKITSDVIASDKGIAQSAVSMLYTAGAAGAEASVPIAGLVVAVVTVGKSFYDLVQDDNQLIAAMKQINAIKAELSDDALGLALTKSTLQTLYSVEEQYLALRDASPGLIDVWTNEQSKVEDAINALRAGASPNQYLDLKTLSISLAAWQTINTFVGQISKADITVGEPVTIDIAKAEIRTTLPFLPRP